MQLSLFNKLKFDDEPKKTPPLTPPHLQIITTPNGRAGEYSTWALSMYSGCGSGCNYCYVPRKATAEKKAKFHAGALPRFSNTKTTRNPLKVLEKDLSKLKNLGYGLETRILMSFGTDPYNSNDVEHELTREAIKLIKLYGLSFSILTKCGSRALRDIDFFRPDGIDEFATTLTCFSTELSEQVEKNAAPPLDRMKTLRDFHNKGIKTWVSLEPLLFPNDAVNLIKASWPYVDEYRIGRLNYSNENDDFDYKEVCNYLIKALEHTTSNYMFKKNLWPYLPDQKHRYVEAKWNKYSAFTQEKWKLL